MATQCCLPQTARCQGLSSVAICPTQSLFPGLAPGAGPVPPEGPGLPAQVGSPGGREGPFSLAGLAASLPPSGKAQHKPSHPELCSGRQAKLPALQTSRVDHPMTSSTPGWLWPGGGRARGPPGKAGKHQSGWHRDFWKLVGFPYYGSQRALRWGRGLAATFAWGRGCFIRLSHPPPTPAFALTSLLEAKGIVRTDRMPTPASSKVSVPRSLIQDDILGLVFCDSGRVPRRTGCADAVDRGRIRSSWVLPQEAWGLPKDCI